MGPLAWPISEMVPCMPMAAPSVFNSDTSATKAEVDDVTTASPNPKPAASTNRSGSDCVYGMATNVAAQIKRPATISGLRPMRSDAPPSQAWTKRT